MIFGGAGRAYDRNVYDYLQLEHQGRVPALRSHLQHAGPSLRLDTPYASPGIRRTSTRRPERCSQANEARSEINLINNDLKTPYSDQFSLGMRNRFDLWNHDWNTSRRCRVGAAGRLRLHARQSPPQWRILPEK